MFPELMQGQLAILNTINQIEVRFLSWRDCQYEEYIKHVEELIDTGINQAREINKLFINQECNEFYTSINDICKEFSISGGAQIMDGRFMTMTRGTDAKLVVAPGAFNTINRTVISLVNKSMELEDQFVLLRQAIQREVASIC